MNCGFHICVPQDLHLHFLHWVRFSFHTGVWITYQGQHGHHGLLYSPKNLPTQHYSPADPTQKLHSSSHDTPDGVQGVHGTFPRPR